MPLPRCCRWRIVLLTSVLILGCGPKLKFKNGDYGRISSKMDCLDSKEAQQAMLYAHNDGAELNRISTIHTVDALHFDDRVQILDQIKVMDPSSGQQYLDIKVLLNNGKECWISSSLDEWVLNPEGQ